MKGQSFRNNEGEIVKVLDYDAINKMVYINVYAGSYKWVHEEEYKTWVNIDKVGIPKEEYIYIPDIPAQMIEEPKEQSEDKPKKKITKKKVDAAD